MRIHIVILIVLSLVVVYLLDFATNESADEESDALDAITDFDYRMTGIDSEHFNADGSKAYRLRANRMTRLREPQYTTIEAPDLEVYESREDASPWFIRAESGVLRQDGPGAERMELSEDVVIRHQTRAGETVHMYTDFVIVSPATRRLHTEQPVRVEADNYRQRSAGMSADLNTDSILFLSGVEGRYD